MWKEFKEFAIKGSVLDLAVGIIIGAAFGKLVSSLVNDIIMPPIGKVAGNVDFKDLFLNLSSTSYPSLAAAKAAGAPIISYGVFLNNIIDFGIVAFSVFLLVKAVNRITRKEKAEAAPPAPSNQEKILTEIRDLMAKKVLWLALLSPVAMLSSRLLAADAAAPTGLQGLAHDSEVGISIASGNSETSTYSAKQLTSYGFDKNILKLGAHYLYSISKEVEAAKNYDAFLRYERELSERFSLYAAHGWEGDYFVGFDYRPYASVGGKYYIIPGDKKTNYLASEVGYRLAYEHHVGGIVPPSETDHFIRAYLEGSKALTETVTAQASIEALPNLAHTDDFQLNFDASVAVALVSHLFLKTGYQGHFRNTPIIVGGKQFDSLLTASLLAKF